MSRILRPVRDPVQAQDLTQETFLRVHQRLADLQDPGALESWLYRTATIQPLVSGDDENQEEKPLADEAALRPDQLLEQIGMSECVLRFLARLPSGQRAVLLLHDLQGYTDPEIATQLVIQNVKMRLRRARVRLRDALAEGCDLSRNDRGVLGQESPEADMKQTMAEMMANCHCGPDMMKKMARLMGCCGPSTPGEPTQDKT